MLINRDQITQFYTSLPEKIAKAKELLQRPLTYAEKVLLAHMIEVNHEQKRGATTIHLFPDRVAMQDATAQMAILQFMLTGKKTTKIPTTIHCDHLIQAQTGAREDLQKALCENNEVYDFLKSAANKYGMGFWKPGSGIIHQIILENYAVPGMMMVGTDSHTPNAGGLGMIAIGVGGADAVDVMVGEAFSLLLPKIIGVKLIGKLNGWSAPKDVILKLAGILTVKGGTGSIIEYFGEGAASISCTGKATITNMGAEIGATASIFPYDVAMARYLKATNRTEIANFAEQYREYLQADTAVLKEPKKYYDQVIEIDLRALEPHIVGPHTPDLARPISQFASDVQLNNWPAEISYALIGSCTNSSYEDLSRAADIVKQAGCAMKSVLLVTPGSEQINKTIERDGIIDMFHEAGATVLANACGPCIGQWKRADAIDGQNSILTSYNRNFKKRNDGNPKTHAFIASPEIVTAMAFAGTLTFNPMKDTITRDDGTFLKFQPPQGEEIPEKGFVSTVAGYEKPTMEGTVIFNPDSNRLQMLTPFPKWNRDYDFMNLRVLVKAKGKCTTDHISPAGPWLRYRGHLDKISDNMFSGAVNAFSEIAGKGKNQMSGMVEAFNKIARSYKENNIGWIAVADENYGEGSSREHAAMEPRYLGCRAVLAKSFARIAETNLKKQGILPLWFTKELDYDLIREDDYISFPKLDVEEYAPVTIEIKHADGKSDVIQATHTLRSEQVNWFYAGSAINYFREKKHEKRVEEHTDKE